MKYSRLFITTIYNIKPLTALMISLVLLIYMGNHTFRAIDTFYQMKAAFLPDMTLTFERARFLLHASIKQDLIRFTSSEPEKNSSLPTVNLYVDKKDIAKLDADLPDSGKKQYVTAYLKTDQSEKLHRVELRYRGASHYHWLYKKKSYRIKLARGDLYNMDRKFNLVNLPTLYMTNEIVNYELAREAGLIAPDYYPTRVYINDEYSGVYMYHSQVDESLLRKHKRMPGSIYYGEKPFIDKDTQESLLWSNEIYWTKAASRSAETSEDRKDIQHFIKGINSTSDIEFYDFVNSYLDKEKFYTFFALDSYFGSNHHDFFHNHKIYFDPYKGKFEPIAWDLRFWTDFLSKDTSFYTLLARIKINPVLEYERDLFAYKLFNKMDLTDVKNRFDKYNNLVYKDLFADKYRDTAKYSAPFEQGAPLPFTMQEFTDSTNYLKNILTSRHQYLTKIYNEVDAIYNLQQIDKNTTQVNFKISGNNPVRVNLKQILDKNNTSASIFRIQPDVQPNNKPQLTKSDGDELLYPGRMIAKGNATGHQSFTLFGSKMLVDAPLYYSFLIKNGNIKDPQKLEVINAITGLNHTIPRHTFNIKKWSDSLHPWKILPKESSAITFSGIVNIKQTREYDSNTRINIKAGTTFLMHAGSSLIFRGKVIAKGNKEQPIVFKQKKPGVPWGSIVTQGQQTSGSRFDYIQVSGGTVVTHNLIHYPGQFNIHDSSDFLIKNCSMKNNSIGDDNMHIAYSSGYIKACKFIDSNSDALDIDISNISVSDSLFLNSGNDAIDLMTTTATISNNLIINSGDKCISTGEWSTGEFSGNVLSHCYIGVEIKDKSEVKLTNNLIFGSKKVAINLYNKNIRYDQGGIVTTQNNYIMDNEKILADERSSYNLEDKSVIYPALSDYKFVEKYFPKVENWNQLKTVKY